MTEEQQIIKKFADILKEKFSSQIKLLLIFGSRAKRSAKPGSDYDFLIVLKKKDSRVIDAIYDEVVTFLIDYGVDLSLKIYSQEDFDRKLTMGTPFVTEVMKSGVKL